MRRVGVLLVALLAAGCGSAGARVAARELPTLVLQPRDLPSYSQFAYGPQARTDFHAGPRQDPTRFGRLGGWIARYRPVSLTVTRGPLVVESRADLFPSPAAAKKDLDAYVAEYQTLVTTNGGRRLQPPQIGDATRGFAFGTAADRFYLVVWRKANATASVLVEGSMLTLGDAVTLARKQEARIVRVAR